MATQNLVSAAITPETKADVLAKIAEIRSTLSFLLSLKGHDIKTLMKVGNNYMPFLDKAYAAVNENPEIMPGLFDLEEFRKDYQLSKDLAAISAQADQLAESLSNTLLAVNSDVIMACLEIYAAVKQNSARVPGLNIVATDLGEFFKRTKHKTEKSV